VFPSLIDDIAGYAAGVLDFLRVHRTQAVISASDGSMAAMLPHRRELEALGSFLTLSPTSGLREANNKARTLAVAQDLGIPAPPTVRIDMPADLEDALAKIPTPCVLKPTTSWSESRSVRLQATLVLDRREADLVIRHFLDRGVGVLVQEWIGGRREGATVMMVGGEVRAAFAHVEWRTTPALGGASVVRESIEMPPDLYDATIRLLKALELDGLCEVEFRRDYEGRPFLMEINTRMSGIVELAVACGVDFPRMLWQWSIGAPIEPLASYRTGLRMRWLRGDMRWLRDNQLGAGRPDTVSRVRGLLLFGSEFFRTTHYDCFDRHDLRPALAELRLTASAVAKGLGGLNHQRRMAEICLAE
jgi:predicted ATP-grasp superfamily ATP-dependent carboligase